jgi:4a-hydroxytetrahydrobiopterin dehydratase
MAESLTAEALREGLAALSGWAVQEGRLEKEYRFESFVAAMAFVNRVAAMAEEMNHHPDIHIHYSRVALELWSHDAGGITERDLRLAEKLP